MRCSLFAGSVAWPCQGMVEPLYPLRCLLAQASQHLWLVNFDDVYREFTCVHHTIHPAPSPPDAGRDTVPSRFGCQSGDCGYRVRRLCTGRDLPAHLRRILLMEQQVWSIQLADNQPCDLVSQLPRNSVECGICLTLRDILSFCMKAHLNTSPRPLTMSAGTHVQTASAHVASNLL